MGKAMESLQNSLVMAGAPGIPRAWEILFSQALRVIGEIATHGRDDPFWTFGGGTVLMLRYGHRFSKDIDIFDFALIAEHEPEVLMGARELLSMFSIFTRPSIKPVSRSKTR